MLCLGHMATLCQSAPQHVAEAVATAIMPVFTLVRRLYDELRRAPVGIHAVIVSLFS